MKPLLLLTCALAASTLVFAQAHYPSKPSRIIAAFAPGSTLDVMGRILGPKLAIPRRAARRSSAR